MTTRHAPIVLAIALLAAPTAWGDVAEAGASHHERVIARAVASPTPWRDVGWASDEVHYLVEVPRHAVVVVQAHGTSTSLFHLHHHLDGAVRPASGWPTSAASVLLSSPGVWRVVVDPAAGAQVRISLSFDGYVGDVGGERAAFNLTDARNDGGCVAREVCLP